MSTLATEPAPGTDFEARCTALVFLAGGATAEREAENAYEQAGLEGYGSPPVLLAEITAGTAPFWGDPRDPADRAADRAAAMARLEAAGWTQAKAAAALGAHGGQPVKVLAAVTA